MGGCQHRRRLLEPQVLQVLEQGNSMMEATSNESGAHWPMRWAVEERGQEQEQEQKPAGFVKGRYVEIPYHPVIPLLSVFP